MRAVWGVATSVDDFAMGGVNAGPPKCGVYTLSAACVPHSLSANESKFGCGQCGEVVKTSTVDISQPASRQMWVLAFNTTI